MRGLWAIIALALGLVAGQARAQAAASLVADSVVLTADNRLLASGNVSAFYQGTTLRATAIAYDRASDRLTITGPVVVQSADGTLLLADSATLDPRLESGLLVGARLVLDQQLQLAAAQINRTDGRYLQLYRGTASSCAVCGTRAPLWDIRAERVVHDRQDQQLYFENAQFRIRGVPVFWLPLLRLPDPTLTRATGFLVPRQRITSQLGTGVKLPYFVTLGDHADVTLTPYVSAKTRTLELTARRAFANGFLRLDGAVSDDSLQPERRSYLFASGSFTLGGAYLLQFDLETVSDKGYLLDYDYSGKDRLDSALSLTRVQERQLQELRLSYFQTLRAVETNASLPPVIAEARMENRHPLAWGGVLRYGLSADLAYRPDGTDGMQGRDILRAGARGDWRGESLLPFGLVGLAQIGAIADLYQITDDSRFAPMLGRIVPQAMVGLRWPLLRQGAQASRDLLEPTVILSWARPLGDTPPNEDSTRSELDPANLFDRSRFAGQDAVETGTQLATGLTWTRSLSGGHATALTLGRIIRDTAQDDFTPSSGLAGQRSDWLLAGQYVNDSGFLLELRGLFDAALDTNRTDGRIRWQNPWASIGASYIWQARDLAENRPNTVAEWTVNGGFVLNDRWALTLDARYDVAANQPVQAGGGLRWQNECVTINLSASRRYSASATVDPTTTFGISGAINGFSAGRSAAAPPAACRP